MAKRFVKGKLGKQKKFSKNSKIQSQKGSISAEPATLHKTGSVPTATANSSQGIVLSSSGKGVVDAPTKLSSVSPTDHESTSPADVQSPPSDRDPTHSHLYPDLAIINQSSLQSHQFDEKCTSLQCGKEQKKLSQLNIQLTEQTSHVKEGDMPATKNDVCLPGAGRFDLGKPNMTTLESRGSSPHELHEAKKKVVCHDPKHTVKPFDKQHKSWSLQKTQSTEQSKRDNQYHPPYNRTGSYEEKGARLHLQYEHDTRQRSQSFYSRGQPGLLHHRYTLRIPVRLPYCPPDIKEYQREYPTMKDDPTKNGNWDFYTGKIVFRPKGSYIDKIHENWWGRYDILECRHDYIQWLFPTRDGSGVSFYAQPLQKHEMEAICADKNAHERVLRSFKMMLDFYGMELNDSGLVTKKKGNWRERFAHLDWSTHNHMRITRILKSLGELGYEFLKLPFVGFVLECIERRELVNVANSCMRYWVETIRNQDDRNILWDKAESIK